ncbi:MAG TPA: class I SAM-dependent methyltransferase, partial [Armatimonadota bacterium]|nr:class I SAM-dependent methyltransferase [Armatimonadota bacterium]
MHAVALAERESVLPLLPVEQDLFGEVIFDHFAGRPGDYYMRRDDNFLERDSSARYFRSWEQMPAHHRCLLSHAQGHVLDLGAGAGQHALVLQERGVTVTAIDQSSRAIEVCRARGVHDARVMEAFSMDFAPESFDTVLLMNNNLGIA